MVLRQFYTAPWACKLDLKNCYWIVLLPPDMQQVIRIAVGSTKYAIVCVPFGWHQARDTVPKSDPLFVLPPFHLRTGDHYLCVCADLLKIYCVFVKQHAGLSFPV